ncbi:CaiB/BaiF CoA transferase family protein [Microbacterium trichothecenolyticum]|uniref:CaiB/BaiF CoA transferase family protein n=1 Tax=Microbacterium trichothecenolyticum TaxID=69370 RepID=UPI001CB78670|nr:CaiB/BaiF CoA-transferase family protein [Microbacterium trichothecenolyticum]
MHRPLDGITVVSCEQAVAAPFASRQLADLGARVIKIERPDGGDFARGYDETVRGMSSHFVWLNRSKESITLDLKSKSGLAAARALAAQADVFIQNFAPGVIERLGLGAEQLRADNPRLTVCNISGYGTSGPMRDAKAYDLLIQSEAGLVSITGTEAEPAKTGIPSADIAAGMYAFSGILAALYAREQTGEGAVLDISLFDSLVEWMGYPMYYAAYGGSAPVRAGTSHAAIAPYGIYASGDGVEFVLSIQNEREWLRFCDVVLDDASIAVDSRFDAVARRVENRPALDAVIAGSLRDVDGAQFEARLQSANIAHARYRVLADVIAHPQLTERGRWTKVGSPVGELDAVLPAISLRGVTPRMDPIPELGADTDRILAELGLGAGQQLERR